MSVKQTMKAMGRRAACRGSLRGGLPPRGYRIEDYASWFPETGDLFSRYLESADLPSLLRVRRSCRVGVVVTPWVSTPVPWYAIMLATGLARLGREVVLIWDDSGFPERDVQQQNRSIGRVLDRLRGCFPVIRLGEQVPAGGAPGDSRSTARLADENVTWALRGARPTEKDAGVAQRIRRSLEDALPLVRSALDRADPGYLVVPGGVYGTSGLFLAEASARGCRVATFDTDRRIAQICVDGIAAQNSDIPTAFHSIWQAGAETRREIVAIARRELRDRTRNRDAYGFQVAPAGGPCDDAEGCVLIPLNVEWDTAALGRHIHFDDTVDWLTSTVAETLAHSAGPVVVRQHPSERRALQRSHLDVAGLLGDRFGGDPRYRFIAADDPISSYDLLRSARLVLPFVSTIGIEAAAMAKPVLVSGSCYYADLGFVWSARSREGYLDLLRRGLRRELPLLPEQEERAWTCYYLSAVQSRVPTDFTPHPEDFWAWCRRPPGELLSDPVVSDILEAIDTGVPVSLLRHMRSPGQAL